MLLTVLVVALTEEGSVIYRQERVGLHNQVFYMYKFRSMIMQDEEKEKAEWSTRNDPRITPVGKLIRRTSIDELPQLFNVLKGEMSLVGPRPLPVYETEAFTSDAHRRRLSVLPGVTGYWQIAGRSNIKEFEKLVELDMYYIDHWSLWLDVKLLLKTVPAVLFARGAK